MVDLYQQIKSDKYAKAFIVTLLLFILLAIVYAITVYQSNKAYRTDILSRKDTVYITHSASVADSLKPDQQVHYAVNTTTADNQAENDVSFTDEKSTTINEASILKKIHSVQQQYNIKNRFISIGEYPAVSEQNTINQLISLLQRKGYIVSEELQAPVNIPHGIIVGKTAIGGDDNGVIIYVGNR